MLNEFDSYHARHAILGTLCTLETVWTAPHVVYKPVLKKDGDRWCALLGDSPNEGVCGYGDTPEKAMAAFDATWIGKESKP